MRPDPEYLRKLLGVFQDSPRMTTDIPRLQSRGIYYRDLGFMFNLLLLNDVGYIERVDGKSGIGVSRTADGVYPWEEAGLRLTTSGLEFGQALGSVSGFHAVQQLNGKVSVRTMRDVAVKAYEAEKFRAL